jgi:hypothetical protein
MSILSAIKQESSSLDDLAKLPQTLIMQMAQSGQISKEMVAPILGKKAEMADATARMRAMQQGGQQQSVMEQIMQKNAQGENPIPQIPTQMQETGVAQIPTREPQYAGGGIVAFAGGGMYDTEALDGGESEAQEMARLYPKSKLGELMDSGMSGIRGLVSKFRGEPTAPVPATPKGSHPYEADAIKAAQQVGLDPNLMLHALYKESGGLKDPATAKSKAGAYGPMQLMAATAKELGVDRTDPYQNILGGATYLKKQLDAFKDPQLALAAYNAGPGAVRKALSSERGLASLPKETHGYMKYAEGGDVKGYSGIDKQSLVEGYDDSSNADDRSMADQYDYDNPYLKRSRAISEGVKNLGKAFTDPRNYDPITKLVLDPMESIRKWGQTPVEKQAADFNAASNARKNVSMTDTSAPKVEPKAEPAKTVPAKSDAPMVAAPASTKSPYSLNPNPSRASIPNAPILSDNMSSDQKKSAQEDYFDMLRKSIEAGRAESKEARAENKAMAILQAGLGMLGGTSPYAMANIGQGAMQGTQAYAQGLKGIREQERDLMSGELGLAKYKSASEASAASLAEQRQHNLAMLGQRQSEQGQRGDEFAQRQIGLARDDYNRAAENIRAGLLKKYPNIAFGAKIPAYEQELYNLLNSPEMISLKQEAYPRSANIPTSTPQVYPGAPAIGTTKGGYKFKGGNPNDKNNWEKI